MISSKTIQDKFVCARCDECCKQPGYVYLKDHEIDPIAHYLEVKVLDFTGKYCDFVQRKQLVLKKKSGGETCIFLKATGCSIHQVKPMQCREFPYKWRTERSWGYCKGLREIGLLGPFYGESKDD